MAAPESLKDGAAKADALVPIGLFGRCMLANGIEIPCQAVAISIVRVIVASGMRPAEGDRVVAYFDHVGRVMGTVEGLSETGFELSIEGTERYRERLGERIAWLTENEHFGEPVERRHERVQPQNRNSRIELEDGRTYPVKIIDISLSGAAFSSPVKPAIGKVVSLAGMKGSVRRHFPEGIAIEFLKHHEHSPPNLAERL